VVGARPNFIKMAAILGELRRSPRFAPTLIHTGQHYSPEMSESFFEQLELPPADVNLNVNGGTATRQTAEIMTLLEPLLTGRRPGLVLVVGDVNSTVAAALVAARLGIPIAHVEAGLRSFDRSMPEEINRRVTDALADYLFASEPGAVANLRAEGIPEEKIFFTGNVMIDTLLRFRDRAARSNILEQLGLRSGGYAVATLHRPANVDDPERLAGLVGVLARLAGRLPVVFPVHPRTRARLEAAPGVGDALRLVPPMSYLDFIRLVSQARVVLTDSGGIQEETTILGVPCLTLRENTERPITIEQGTNRLAGVDAEEIHRAACQALEAPPQAGRVPELWDGQAAARIREVLERTLA